MRFRIGTAQRATALVVIGALALAGCGGPDESEKPDKTPTSTSSTPDEPEESETAPVVEPGVSGIGFDPDQSLELPEENVKLVRLSETTVFTVTDKTITAHPVGSAEITFEADAGGIGTWMDLWISEDGAEALALRMDQEVGTGTTIGDVSAELLRLDPATGEAATVARLGSPSPSQGIPTLTIRAVVYDVAIVEKWVEGSGDRTVQGVDLTKGKTRWVRKQLTFVTAVDDVVVLNKGNVFVPGRLVAVRAASGKDAWRGYEGARSVSLVGLHDGVLTVAGNDSSNLTEVLTRLNPRTGRMVGKQRPLTSSEWRCAPNEGRVTVCQDAAGGLVGVDLERNRVAWKLPTQRRFAPTMTVMRDGNVYGYLPDGRSVIIDARTGKDVGAAGAAPNVANDAGGLVVFVGKAVWFPYAE